MYNIPLNNKTLFFSGAGILVSAPTNAPDGWTLTKYVIDSFYPKGTFEKILSYYKHFKMKDSNGILKEIPRLETILSDIYNLNPNYLKQVLDVIADKPNNYHELFAKHLENGGYHITLNFDDKIEEAYKDKYLTQNHLNSQLSVDVSKINIEQSLKYYQSKVIHLHGKYSENINDIENIGATIENISLGFSNHVKQSIIDIFLDVENLVFVGYGGQDYFDVTPMFREFSEKYSVDILKHLNVYWFEYTFNSTNIEPKDIDKIIHGGKIILDSLKKLGANITYLEVDTGFFFDKFIKNGFSTDYPKFNKKPLDCYPKEYKREFESILFIKTMSKFGMQKDVLDELKKYKSLEYLFDIYKKYDSKKENYHKYKVYNLKEQFLLSILLAYFDDAKFDKVIEIAKKYYDSNSYVEKFIAYERIFASYWLSKRYKEAYVFHTKNINELEKIINNQKDNDSLGFTYSLCLNVYIEYIITFLHYYRDIKKKNLDFVNQDISIEFFKKLNNQEFENIILANPQWLAKIRRLKNEINALENIKLNDKFSNRKEEISEFVESDSFLGNVNFLRRVILDRLKKGKVIRCDEMIELIKKSFFLKGRLNIQKSIYLSIIICILRFKKNFKILKL
jgi:hypothetical protein